MLRVLAVVATGYPLVALAAFCVLVLLLSGAGAVLAYKDLLAQADRAEEDRHRG